MGGSRSENGVVSFLLTTFIVAAASLFSAATASGSEVDAAFGPVPDGPASVARTQGQRSASKVHVVAASAMRLHSLGRDRWDVWVCRIPRVSGAPAFDDVSPRRVPITPRGAVRRLRRVIAPYFLALSGGRYRQSFRPRKVIPLGRNQGSRDCEERARRGSAGRDGALIVTNLAAEGPIWAASDRCADEPSRRRPARICAGRPHTLPGNRRVAWVSADTLLPVFRGEPRYPTVAHELGHTLAWPHSFTGRLFIPIPDDPRFRVGIAYDDPSDVMGYERLWGTGSWWNPRAGRFPLKGTQAFNRIAAGWIRRSEISVHRAGSRKYRLRPVGRPGTQVLIVPTADRRAFLTVEARVRRGVDRGLPVAGVNVHAVDQRGRACTFNDVFRSCWGDWRRQVPMPPRPDRLASTVRPGHSMKVAGVRIRNLGRARGGGFRVRVVGRRARLPLIKPEPCMASRALCPGPGPWRQK